MSRRSRSGRERRNLEGKILLPLPQFGRKNLRAVVLSESHSQFAAVAKLLPFSLPGLVLIHALMFHRDSTQHTSSYNCYSSASTHRLCLSCRQTVRLDDFVLFSSVDHDLIWLSSEECNLMVYEKSIAPLCRTYRDVTQFPRL